MCVASRFGFGVTPNLDSRLDQPTPCTVTDSQSQPRGAIRKLRQNLPGAKADARVLSFRCLSSTPGETILICQRQDQRAGGLCRINTLMILLVVHVQVKSCTTMFLRPPLQTYCCHGLRVQCRPRALNITLHPIRKLSHWCSLFKSLKKVLLSKKESRKGVSSYPIRQANAHAKSHAKSHASAPAVQ